MVADALVYHPSVTHSLKFLSTTVGREKLFRTVQYFARFYAWYLLRTNSPASAAAPWTQTKKQLGLVRKFLRLGKTIEHLKLAAVATDSKAPADPVLRYTSVARQIGYAGYLSLEAGTVLDAAGIRRWQGAKRLQQEAYRFWLMGLSCSVVAQLYTLWRLKEREARIDRKDGEGVVESKRITMYGPVSEYHFHGELLTIYRERSASHNQLVSDLCDLSISLSALGWVALDDGFVGIAGTVSSLLAVYNQWKKTA